jgi:hypothetical protein
MKHATFYDNDLRYVCGKKNYAQSNSVDERIALSKPTFPAYAIKKYMEDKTVCQQCKNKAVIVYKLIIKEY